RAFASYDGTGIAGFDVSRIGERKELRHWDLLCFQLHRSVVFVNPFVLLLTIKPVTGVWRGSPSEKIALGSK
ncbi:MAG: hypothetical protein AAGE61_20575, partial [Pseudomonadota bacterium]